MMLKDGSVYEHGVIKKEMSHLSSLFATIHRQLRKSACLRFERTVSKTGIA